MARGTRWAWGLILGLVILGVGVMMSGERGEAAGAVEPQIGHMVFFKLKDASEAKTAELVAACKKYLDKHPGTVYFSAGARGKEFDRPVNDQEWDVALHVVFKTKADHDKYQDAPRHLQFIEENKANWSKVRVFDSKLLP